MRQFSFLEVGFPKQLIQNELYEEKCGTRIKELSGRGMRCRKDGHLSRISNQESSC